MPPISREFKRDTIERALSDARALAEEITGDPLVREKINPEFKEVRRKSGVAGKARSGKVIELNMMLLTTEEQFTSTLYHELAHVICYHVYGQGTNHSKKWKQVMIDLGREPNRCHEIDLHALMPDKWPLAICQRCGNKITISKRFRDECLRRGRKFSCKRCKGEIKL